MTSSQKPQQEIIPQSVVSLNGLAELDKTDLSLLAAASVEYCVEGGHDTLSLLALAAKLEHFAAEVKKTAKRAGLNELASYDKGVTSKVGVKLEVADTGVSYDYSNDPVWTNRMADVTAAKSLVKDWEEFLKRIPHTGLVVSDPDTGEEYKAYPPLRTATESIKASIK